MMKFFTLILLLTGSLQFAYAQNDYHEVTLVQLAEKVQSNDKKYIIFDVRSSGEYADTTQKGKHVGIGRIKTAISIPIQDLFEKPTTLDQISQYKNQEVYVICSHSYRSRAVSNLLLKNGFTNVNNVKGGMTEWYRDYDALQPYRSSIYENNIGYQNLAPSQLFQKLKVKEAITLIGFKNPPLYSYDSLMAPFYQYFPTIKNSQYYAVADSLQVLEKVKAANGNAVVLYNIIGNSSGEIADWLARKGYKNIYNLVGSLLGFFEYMANYQPGNMAGYLISPNTIQFVTPLSYCSAPLKNVQWIDIRHDTLFNKTTVGTKLSYKTIKGAVNFPGYKNASDFAAQFPDKNKTYLILTVDGTVGIELADAIAKKGYHVAWLQGGLERWEWYTNNIEPFNCKDYLIQ